MFYCFLIKARTYLNIAPSSPSEYRYFSLSCSFCHFNFSLPNLFYIHFNSTHYLDSRPSHQTVYFSTTGATTSVTTSSPWRLSVRGRGAQAGARGAPASGSRSVSAAGRSTSLSPGTWLMETGIQWRSTIITE